MANKLIVAAAGSGKTTHLVQESLRKAVVKTLVTTFTDENESEIIKRFYELNGCIPNHVVVQTWFSFLLEHGVKPFQGSLTARKITGVFLVNGRSGKKADTKRGPIYWGEEEDFDRHYFTSDYRVFSDKIAKLAFRCNEKSNGSVVKRIARIFPRIFVDEAQDLAGYDLELLILLMMAGSSVLMVADPRQWAYSTHYEAKNRKYAGGRIAEFIREKCSRMRCEVDSESLKINYRCNERICKLADQLFPEYPPCSSAQETVTGHDGVFLVRPKDVGRYLEVFKPMQLRWSVSVPIHLGFPATNFGNAKGRTYDRVLIYPTDDFVKWLKNRSTPLKSLTKCRLYVALTRAKYSVAIVMDFSDRTPIEDVEKFTF